MLNVDSSHKNQGTLLRIIAVLVACIIIGTVLVVNTHIKIVVINGSSMFPTLRNGEIVLVKSNEDLPTHGDIVVFRSNQVSDNQDFWIKRVIGVAGDVVEINYDANTVTINKKLLEESYINLEESDPMRDEEEIGTISYSVPNGHYFVMGDNRNHSSDSRAQDIGMIPQAWVIGKVVEVPFSKRS